MKGGTELQILRKCEFVNNKEDDYMEWKWE